MDAREYDRIGDMLMQIKKQIGKLEPTKAPTIATKIEMAQTVDLMLELNDKLAQWDDKGWL